MKFVILTLMIGLLGLGGCTRKTEKKQIWIYTSLYKDTIADIQPKLEKEFPEVSFNFYQAGSEEVAAKFNAEQMAGGAKADLLISSDRFWYEDLARQGKLHAFKPKGTEGVSEFFRHPEGFYTTLSFPVMVMAYNSDAVSEKDKPKTFKELAEAKWKSKVSSGSPLASGTSFTTVAFLQQSYGWDFFKSLRKNDFFAEGGNSGVIRRLQSKERPVGVVLLENILRLQDSDQRIKPIFPEDGVIMQSNVLALVKKTEGREVAEKIADWLFGTQGQEAMVRSYMYAAMPGYSAPRGAPELKEIQSKAKVWNKAFIEETLKSREGLKEEFTKIMF